MIPNSSYFMSCYLMFRCILDSNYRFSGTGNDRTEKTTLNREKIYNSNDLYVHLKNEVRQNCADGKSALMLSGGIDSAILASFMPESSTTYTLKCVVPGIEVTDETLKSKRCADRFNHKNEIIEVYWEDYEKYAPLLMSNKGAPIHSIEVQIYKAALKAKKDGYTKLIFGENADTIYGGLDGLLKKEWKLGEFIERFSYIMPYKVLKDPQLILEPFYKHTNDGYVDVHRFINDYFRIESLGAYINACETAGIDFVCPYADTEMAVELDYERVRSGDSKYFVREVYKSIFGNEKMPEKIPMPRPMDEWLSNWDGPSRPEFLPHCIEGMTGDQKWMVYSLEKYLNKFDNKYPEV